MDTFHSEFYNCTHENINDILIILRKYKDIIKYDCQPDAIIEKFMSFDINEKNIKDIFNIININILCEENSNCYGKLVSLLDSIEDLYEDNKDKKYKFLLKKMRKLGAKRATEMNKKELQQNCYKNEPLLYKENKSISELIINNYYYDLINAQIKGISREMYEDIDYIINNCSIENFKYFLENNKECINNKKLSKIIRKIKNIHKTVYSSEIEYNN